MQTHYVRCFVTDAENSGNLAAVVEQFADDKATRQQLATANNLPVTSFIDRHDSVYRLSYYYPACEMALCMHGTLAAARRLFNYASSTELLVETAAGQTLTLLKGAEYFYEIAVGAGKVLPMPVPESEMLAMLNTRAAAIDRDLPCCVATIGSPKLLIPIQNLPTLARLQPDFAKILAWSMANGVNGLYVYCQETLGKADFHARAFNPKGGLNEDAATGVAAAALLTALDSRSAIVVEQGHGMKQASLIHVRKDHKAIYIGGRVLAIAKPSIV